MKSPRLTIAVPTFNRHDPLRGLMRQLFPQLAEGVRLVIRDNCSDVPAATVIEPFLQAFPSADVRVERNRVNVGANANILRCFEECATDWIWVVGDDDEITDDAVATILQRVREHPECLLINFPIDDSRREAKLVTGLEHFSVELDKAADVPWITSTVYNAPKLLPNIRFGYQYAFSMLPHIAMLMMSFRDADTCYFATDPISSRDRAGAATDQQTPIVNMALGFPVLLDLPIRLDVRRRLVEKLLVTNDSPGLPLRQLAYQLLLLSLKTGDGRTSRYYFDQACRRRFYFGKTVGQRFEILAYRLLLRLPPSGISWGYRRLKGRDMGQQVHQDRIARL